MFRGTVCGHLTAQKCVLLCHVSITVKWKFQKWINETWGSFKDCFLLSITHPSIGVHPVQVVSPSHASSISPGIFIHSSKSFLVFLYLFVCLFRANLAQRLSFLLIKIHWSIRPPVLPVWEAVVTRLTCRAGFCIIYFKISSQPFLLARRQYQQESRNFMFIMQNVSCVQSTERSNPSLNTIL